MDNDLSRFDALLENAKARKLPKIDYKDALSEYEAYKAQKNAPEQAYKAQKNAPKKVTTPAIEATKKKQPTKDFI